MDLTLTPHLYQRYGKKGIPDFDTFLEWMLGRKEETIWYVDWCERKGGWYPQLHTLSKFRGYKQKSILTSDTSQLKLDVHWLLTNFYLYGFRMDFEDRTQAPPKVLRWRRMARMCRILKKCGLSEDLQRFGFEFF